MNILKNTLLYKTYSLIKSINIYLEEYNYIKDTFYSNEFKLVLKKYMHVDIKKDWIGRLYGIINPIIDINGNLDINSVIVELDGINTNNQEYVQVWIHKQLKLIADLFKINKLYDYISLELNKVGPEELDNYLLVFDIVSRKDMVNKLKSFSKHIIFYIIIVILFIIGHLYMNII